MEDREAAKEWRARVRSLASMRPKELRWLWPGRIPQGKLTILSGDPNLGKSFLTLDIAARVSAGRPWPDEEQGTGEAEGAEASEKSPAEVGLESGCAGGTGGEVGEVGGGVGGRVLLLAAEDDAEDTILPRLQRAGADLARIDLLEGMQPVQSAATKQDPEAGRSRLVSLLEDLDQVEKVLRERGEGVERGEGWERVGYRLVVIDPISAYLEDLNPNSNNSVRRLLSGLARLAAESGAAVLIVSHLRKSSAVTPAVYRTIGSLAFTAVARSLWTVVKDPQGGPRRLLVPVKMNLVAEPLGLAYRIAEPGVVEWEPEPLYLDADERGANALSETDGDERRKLARRWLHIMLMDGKLPSNEVKRRAARDGIGQAALWEAKKKLGVMAVKEGKTGPWYWELPMMMKMVMPEEDFDSPFLWMDQLPVPELIRRVNEGGGIKKMMGIGGLEPGAAGER